MNKRVKNIEITDEMREKLKNFSPIKEFKTFEYVPKAYYSFPKDLRPVFTLQGIGGIDKCLSQDHFIPRFNPEGTDIHMTRGEYTKFVCQRGIVGWENYYDLDTGEEVEYSSNALNHCGWQLLHELANVILDPDKAKLTEEEKLGLK